MTVGFRVVVVAALASLAVGCGGAKLDREGAARMATGAAQKGQTAQASGGLYSLMQSGAAEGSVTVDCTAGGTATLSFASIDLSNSFQFTFDMAFDGCTEPMWDDPETPEVEQEEVTQDGALTMTISADATGASFTIQGEVEYSGAVRDSVQMDLTQTLSVDTNTGTVVTTLNGSIETSTETHTYNNETWRLTATGEFVRDGEA